MKAPRPTLRVRGLRVSRRAGLSSSPSFPSSASAAVTERLKMEKQAASSSSSTSSGNSHGREVKPTGPVGGRARGEASGLERALVEVRLRRERLEKAARAAADAPATQVIVQTPGVEMKEEAPPMQVVVQVPGVQMKSETPAQRKKRLKKKRLFQWGGTTPHADFDPIEPMDFVEKFTALRTVFDEDEVYNLLTIVPELGYVDSETTLTNLAAMEAVCRTKGGAPRDGKQIAMALPWMLLFDGERMREAAEELGLDNFLLFAKYAPKILLRDLPNVKSKMDILAASGMSAQAAVKFLNRRPAMITMPDEKWRERIEALSRLPRMKGGVERILRRLPSILHHDPETIQSNLDTLAREMPPSIDVMFLVSRQPSLLSSNSRTVMRVMAVLEELFPEVPPERMVTWVPALLTYNADTIRKKWTSLVNHAAIDVRWKNELDELTKKDSARASLALLLCYSSERHKRLSMARKLGPARHSVVSLLAMKELEFILQYPSDTIWG